MKRNIILLLLCGLLMSCSTFNSGDPAPPAEGSSDVPAVDSSVGTNQEAPPANGSASATNTAVTQGQAAGDFPVDIGPDAIPPKTEQVNVDNKTPPLKPVHPYSSWSVAGASSEAPKSRLHSKVKSSSKAKASAKAKALAKAKLKKPTKAQCKQFAKNPKKHKKELAMCKKISNAKRKKSHDL